MPPSTFLALAVTRDQCLDSLRFAQNKYGLVHNLEELHAPTIIDSSKRISRFCGYSGINVWIRDHLLKISTGLFIISRNSMSAYIIDVAKRISRFCGYSGINVRICDHLLKISASLFIILRNSMSAYIIDAAKRISRICGYSAIQCLDSL